MEKDFKKSIEQSRLSQRVKAELIGIALLIVGIFLLLALLSYSSTDPSFNTVGVGKARNLAGVAGSYVADIVISGFGWAGYMLPLAILVYALRYMFLRPVKYPGWVALGYSMLIFSSAGIGHLLYGQVLFDKDYMPAGGAVGYLIGSGLTALFNEPGSYLILSAILLGSVMFTVNFSLIGFGDKLRMAVVDFFIGLRERWILKKEQRAKERERKQQKTTKRPSPHAPRIIADDGTATRPKPAQQETFEFAREVDGYHLPPEDVFDKGSGLKVGPDEESLLMSSKLLLKKLQDFGVQGTVETVRPGPVVTMFEFKPASGVKINKIVNLADDLALALRALSIRIVAPIPGKDTVGVEIPNVDREMVMLGEIFNSAEYRRSESKLTIALGKDIAGNPVVADLSKMPHLLIAGATGSGKSVAVHSILASLLQRATPKEVRLMIVDPKMLELSVYDDIPHLLLPVVTQAKMAAVALKWVVSEMESRYRLMAEEGVRNIGSYNRKVEKYKPTGEEGETVPEHLPFIVVVIDELADLMMVASKDVEESIARLAQMARAAGIHLIVATQRPSVDVITGMIKANFPARIAFQVASKVDSRTILDTGGAEALLGGGDMLFLPPGTAKLTRVHGSYVSERDIAKMVKFLRAQGRPDYDESILEEPEQGELGMDDEFDTFYDQAVAFVSESRHASVSMVQRRFKIGYNRAARIIEMMEREGVVGPSRGAKPREVLVRKL